MKQHFYRDRDHAFGQLMLSLRSAMELTQAQLAEALNVSSRAVGDWEAGESYPKAERLKQFIALAVSHRAFHTGREAEEIQALWKAARQKVLLNEMWLADLLSNIQLNLTTPATPANEPIHETSYAISSPVHGRRVDWGDAITVRDFFGREWELARLTGWVVEEHCRVVGLLGVGGIGKSALSVNLMRQIAPQFDVVIWRSLRDAPTCESLLDSCLQVLASQPHGQALVDLEQRLNLLIEYLRGQRALVILDNLETLLEEGADTGNMRSGYEGYARLISRVGETEHQSCLLFTSREKPIHLTPLEGTRSFVRILRLTRLESKPCEQLLTEKGVAGSEAERARLIDMYAGNPLALKIVAQTIVDLFDGEIAPFLAQGEIIFGSIRALLAEQFGRLSALEQCILVWLAIMREPTSLDELMAVMVTPVLRPRLLEAIESLHRRSLIEHGQIRGSFTLQSVVLEYATAQLIEQIGEEIRNRKPVHLLEYGLVLSHAHEYNRQTQERLIAAPIIALLQSIYGHQVEVEEHLLRLLAQFASLAENVQGYGPANLLTLVRMLRGHLRGLDLSRLLLRGAYLQAVNMQDSSLAYGMIRDSVFTQSFGTISSLGMSGNGEYWATGSWNGEIRIFKAGGRVLYRLWRTLVSSRIALSTDGRLLAGGSADGEIRVWDVAKGALMWSSGRGMSLGHTTQLAFSPNGRVLATASDTGLRLWDTMQGTLLVTLPHLQPVPSITWRSDGTVLASGDTAGTIRFWTIDQDTSADLLMTIDGHGGAAITALAFSPQGNMLVSGCWNGMVKVWNAADGCLYETLANHAEWIQCLDWSPDGQTIAYFVRNETGWLWDVEQHRHRAALREHTTFVRGLHFTPDSCHMVSASEDGTIRMWDAMNGVCTRINYGYAARVDDMSWSPDGMHLVSVESDPSLIMYPINDAMPATMLHGHTDLPYGVRWSPDGHYISSYSYGNTIHLWDGNTGEQLESLSYTDDSDNLFRGLAWSPDGRHLAAGTKRHGIQLFDITTRSMRPLEDRQTLISGYAMRWSPDGTMLAASCEDDTVSVWDVTSGAPLLRVPGERWCLTWSADSTRLAIFESRDDGSELVMWDIAHGERKPFALHPSVVIEIVWMQNDKLLLTGCSDGWLRWWDGQTGDSVLQVQAHPDKLNVMKLNSDETLLASSGEDGGIIIRDAHTGTVMQTLRRDRPYERMDITGIRGLTEAQKATLHSLGAVENSAM